MCGKVLVSILYRCVGLALLFACNRTTVTMPDLPTDDTPLVLINRGIDFSWDGTRGALLFAGTQGTEPQLRALIARFNSVWPGKQLVFNMCSETSGWFGTLWALGPPALSPENRENLARFLRVTAETGTLVRLNIFCSVRDQLGWMDKYAEQYARQVATDVRDFNHVFLSVSNEPVHPDSWFNRPNTMERLRRIRDIARLAGFVGPMGADDGLARGAGVYEYAYSHLGFVPDFHPFRNPDPQRKHFRRLVAANGLPLIISESTCYSTWHDLGGLCTDDKEQILDYLRGAEREGIVFFFHSTDGLQWPQKPHFDWIPET